MLTAREPVLKVAASLARRKATGRAEEVDQVEDGDQVEEGASTSTGPGGIGTSVTEMATEEATSHLAVEQGRVSDAASEMVGRKPGGPRSRSRGRCYLPVTTGSTRRP
jgi:hypothetical protein